MVIARASVRSGTPLRRSTALWCLSLGVSLACGKIVGITETEVSEGQGGVASGSGGAAPGAGGSAGVRSPGSGGNAAGTASGGAAESGGMATSGAAPGGSAGRTQGGSAPGAGGSPGGSSNPAGGTSSGGSTGLNQAGAGPGGGGPEGGSGGSGDCNTGDVRCGAAGRQVCEAGEWTNSPCALNLPTCEAGKCIVRGPTLVKVGAFYIDSTEVTAAQYQTFLDAKGNDTSGQPSVCSWNTEYKEPSIPMNPDNWPMAQVDWCDARAFCAWADKHLCGAATGGAISREELFVSAKSQWFLACGGPNGATHPNSNSVCNSSAGFENVAPVASFPGCEGYYPGLFDLEGNVAEWVDGCNGSTGAKDFCYVVGGSIFDSRSYCTGVYDETPRDALAPSYGFRCCSG